MFKIILPGIEVLLTICATALVLLVLAELFRLVKNIQTNFKNVPDTRTNKDMPGPLGLPVIGILHQIARPGIDIIGLVQELVLKYGKIFRLKILMNEFVTLLDPVHIEVAFSKALKSTNPGHLNPPNFLRKILSPQECSTSLFFTDYTTWKRHNDVLSRLFTENGIENQIKLVNRHSKNLVREIGDYVDNRVNPSVGEMLHRYVLDMILELIFDREMLSSKEQAMFIKNLGRIGEIGKRRVREPWLLLPPVWWLHPLRRELGSVSEELKNVTLKIAKKYQGIRYMKRTLGIDDNENESEEDEFRSSRFQCMMELMVGAGIQNEEIFQETMAIIMSGDTTSFSITYLLFNLARHPEIQERCRNEVDQLFDTKSLLKSSRDKEGDLTVADLNSLEDLDRCMKESLRMVPVAHSFIRQLEEPLEIEENLQLDSNTVLLFSPWITQRDERYYPEPEKFDRDRFLPDECKNRHPYAYIPFSGGNRNCLAYESAQLTIKLVTAYILRNFEIETRDKWEDLEFVFAIVVKTRKDVNLILKSRVGIS